MPGICLPTNPLTGSEDPEGAQTEVVKRSCSLVLLEKVLFTAFPSGNLGDPAG